MSDKYSQGICTGAAAILKNGQTMTPEEIIRELCLLTTCQAELKKEQEYSASINEVMGELDGMYNAQTGEVCSLEAERDSLKNQLAISNDKIRMDEKTFNNLSNANERLGNEVDDLREHRDEMQHVMFLAAKDVVFFYEGDKPNEEVDENKYFGIAINCGDTFMYACADAEEISPNEAKVIRKYLEQYGWDGVTAYAAHKRGWDVIPPLRTDKFKTAMQALTDNKGE